MMIFHPPAPLCEKHGEPVFNQDSLNNITIIGKCRQVFSCCSSETSGYEFTHPDFPGKAFHVSKKNFIVSEEDDICCMIVRLCNLLRFHLFLLLGLKKLLWQQQMWWKKISPSIKLFVHQFKINFFFQQPPFDYCMLWWKKY